MILALMLREARTRYGRTKAGYLWALLEPMMHIGGFAIFYSFRIMKLPLGDSVLLFLATGFATFIGFRHVLTRTAGGYGSNKSLLTFPIVRVMDVFLGRALLELATWVTVSFIIYTGLILAGIAPLPDSVMKMLAAIIALFCIAFGAGLFIGIVGEFWASMRSFMSVPMRLLYFTSAVFYLPDPLPPAIRDILAWNPILHGITLVREGYYRGYQSHLLDVGYLYSWAIGCVLVGLVAERIARKPMRSLAI